MASIRHGISIGLLMLAPLAAQEIKLPPGLGANSTETVEVTLDSNMLQLASKFLSDKESDEAQAKKLIGGLKSILVRSFEFDKPGQYSTADVEAIRSQFRGPGWSRIVGVDSKKEGENADVFVKSESGTVGGMAVIVAEAKQLTIVSIVGAIDPAQLSGLSGKFGIPKLDIGKKKKPAKDD
jgi:hypothetical protein